MCTRRRTRRLTCGALTVLIVCAIAACGGSTTAAASENPHRALIASMLAVAAPLPLLAITGSVPAALLLAAVFGAGSVTAEVIGDTCLQRSLDPAVFARAYGLVLPAFLGGIAAGALIAPLAITLVGVTGTLAMIATAVVAYGTLVLSHSEHPKGPAIVAAAD